MSRTRITLQDIIDRGLHTAGWQVTVDGAGNFVLTAPDGGGGAGGLGVFVTDEGVPLGTGTTLDFTGGAVQATISGTVVNVDVVAIADIPATGTVVLYDETSLLGSVDTLIVQGEGIEAFISGSVGYIYQTGSAGVDIPATGSVVLYDETSILGSVDTLIVQGENIEAFVSGSFGYIYQTGSAGAPNKVLLYDQDLDAALEYDTNSGGFNQALALAEDGDVIWIPPATIEGDFTIPLGVSIVGISRSRSIFTGEVTLGAYSSIERLTIQRTDDSGNDLKGVVNHDGLGVVAKIIDCEVLCTQNGTGTVYAISIDDNGDIEVWNSNIEANGDGGGAAYAGHHGGATVGGFLRIYSSRAHGTTAPFLED